MISLNIRKITELNIEKARRKIFQSEWNYKNKNNSTFRSGDERKLTMIDANGDKILTDVEGRVCVLDNYEIMIALIEKDLKKGQDHADIEKEIEISEHKWSWLAYIEDNYLPETLIHNAEDIGKLADFDLTVLEYKGHWEFVNPEGFSRPDTRNQGNEIKRNIWIKGITEKTRI